MGRAEDLFLRLQSSGESALDEFITTRKSEELFLDFKQSSDHGKGARLSDSDRNNLCKAISGFGNSEGGVVVWGVDCSRDSDGSDVARAKHPLDNVERFVSWLEGAVSGCTIPPHSGVRNFAIRTNSTAQGFAVTYIPASDRAPHQDINKKLYYIRAGSDFVPAPHAVLAGLFGRRPQPNVIKQFTYTPVEFRGMSIHCEVGVLLRNQGPGVARDLFVNVMVHRSPGSNCKLKFEQPDSGRWTGVWSFGRHISLISPPDFRLPPEAHVQPLVMEFDFAPPFASGIEIEGMVGSGESVPRRFKMQNSKETVAALYDDLMERRSSNTITSSDVKEFAAKLLFQVE